MYESDMDLVGRIWEIVNQARQEDRKKYVQVKLKIKAQDLEQKS